MAKQSSLRKLIGSEDSIGDYLSSFERELNGASPIIEGAHNYHIPACILNGTKTLAEAEEIRRKIGVIPLAPMLFSPEGLDPNDKIELTISELDPRTGETLHDPKVSGIWHVTQGAFDPVKDDTITINLYTRLKEYADRYPNTDPTFNHAREGKSYAKESQAPMDPEKG